MITLPNIYSLTTEAERKCLSMLAKEVPIHGYILEIGCLYGGVTAVLALSAPFAYVSTIDDFSWSPENMPKATKELAEKSFIELGIKNIKVFEGDSIKIGREWKTEIDLLWIDGGHSFNYVYSDLINFGPHSRVIALHDYDNPIWETIRQAVEIFIGKYPEWHLANVVDTVAVLRRK